MGFARFGFIAAAPLLLVSCLLTPGKFVSSLDIKKDRSFTFAYAGEVIYLDPSEEASKTPTEVEAPVCDADNGEDCPAPAPEPAPPAVPAAPKPETAEQLAKRRAIADALAKEIGYRSAVYLGQGKYRVDYSIAGKLDRGFVFPFNGDAGAIIPWLAIEVRNDGTARFRASAFGQDSSNRPDKMMAPGDGADKEMAERDGTFTLTTDAELVMHNNEEGTAPGAGPGKTVVWKVTPATKTVPTAVVRFVK